MTKLFISILIVLLTSLLMGVFIDAALGISPWGVVISMLAGMSLALLLVVRYFNRSFSTLAPPPDNEDTSERY